MPDGFRHAPVLLAETLEWLRPRPGETVLDCTLGLGGHSQALLAAGATVIGVDRDPRARALAKERLAAYGERFHTHAGTFAEAGEAFVAEGRRFAAVLADLGVSSMQLDDDARGFAIRSEAAPDMRMGEGAMETALELIDRLDEAALADLIFAFGEERFSRRIARAIKYVRGVGRLLTAADLAAAVRRAVPGHAPRHPALRTFQALRIAVNDELGQLDRLLGALPALLVAGGRAVVISFHSLEDRAVKQAFRAHAESGAFAAIARRVVVPSDQEAADNPRAASAKLRWAVRAPLPEDN